MAISIDHVPGSPSCFSLISPLEYDSHAYDSRGVISKPIK